VTVGATGVTRRSVQATRRLLAQRQLATLICAAALLLKLLVPTGYMIDDSHGRIAITICSGTGPATTMMDIPGMHAGASDHGKSKDHGKAEMPCAFSGLSAAVLAAIDPILLAGLIAFIISVGFSGSTLPLISRRAYLRPPLRGPPASL
jgi:hypothetical protein